MSELPQGWSLASLGMIAEIATGSTPKRSESKYWDENGFPWLTSSVTGEPFCNNAEQFVSQVAIEECRLKVFKKSTLLLAMYGEGKTRGQVTEIMFDATCNQACAAITVDQAYVKNSYVKYRLVENYELTRKAAVGGNQPNLNLTKVRDIPVPLAPLAEQKRIVEKLDEVLVQVDTIKARLDGIPSLLKRFRQSVLASAVSGKLTEEWRGNCVSKIVSELIVSINVDREKLYLTEIDAGNKDTKRLLGKVKKHKPTLPSDELPSSWIWTSFMESMDKVVDCHNKTAPYIEEGVPLIRTPDIRNGKISLEGAMYISQETYDYWSRRCPPVSGDIIFTREAPMGEAGIVPDNVTLCMGQRMMLLRPNSNYIDPKYVLLNIMSLNFQERMGAQAIGTGVKHLRVADVESLSYPLAPLEEQKEIVRLVDQYFAFADTIEAQVNKAQARVDNLTQSILAKAFRGELVAQDPNDEPADKLLERIAEARKEAEALAKAAKKAETAKKRAVKSA
ncbi:restriction endonuclease subunit S [Vibrio splendidus]|uniref:restriction endonuclease subunit S n=1 Tax=Vibrio splendidus TaxID=29497 RepID=UPI000C81718F|nr:restriction endonuclease subunit S [Vibrio splendidus]PMK43667.1 hypothetical protein BCU01_11420 [Vibrio splendidus]